MTQPPSYALRSGYEGTLSPASALDMDVEAGVQVNQTTTVDAGEHADYYC